MARWNYLGYSRHGVVPRHRHYPKRLTTIGRGDFHDGYSVREPRAVILLPAAGLLLCLCHSFSVNPTLSRIFPSRAFYDRLLALIQGKPRQTVAGRPPKWRSDPNS